MLGPQFVLRLIDLEHIVRLREAYALCVALDWNHIPRSIQSALHGMGGIPYCLTVTISRRLHLTAIGAPPGGEP